MKKQKYKNNIGFTLVELMIAVALFSIIAFISLGAIISIFDANKRAESSKTIVDNLNFSIENMTRTIRFGTNYDCGGASTPASPNDCSLGSSELALSFNGSSVVYRLNGTAIQKSIDGGFSFSNITASGVVIERLQFFVFGSTFGDTVEPFVIVLIKGFVGNKPTTQSGFLIQSLVSQRALDI